MEGPVIQTDLVKLLTATSWTMTCAALLKDTHINSLTYASTLSHTHTNTHIHTHTHKLTHPHCSHTHTHTHKHCVVYTWLYSSNHMIQWKHLERNCNPVAASAGGLRPQASSHSRLNAKQKECTPCIALEGLHWMFINNITIHLAVKNMHCRS